MLCNICNKNQATVHLTEIVDEQMSELHLCDECARKKSMEMEQQFGLSDLLAGLVDYGKQIGSVDKGPVVAQCSYCGLAFEDFGKIGRLGCSECYTSFSKNLGPLLKRIHGSNQHMGKVPLGFKPLVVKKEKSVSASVPAPANLNELKDNMQKAIESEEFEEAARLRDLIKEMELKANEVGHDKEPEKKKHKKTK
jgi:protein arginine kinase activator